MNVRSLLSCATLALICAHTAWSAEGAYQKTKDGQTTVWNGTPKPGDVATWSGGRDEKGYASGEGTLVWYSPRESFLNNGKPGKPVVFARYTGRMVHGKLDGMVTAQQKGVTSHATFSNGRKISHWVAGRAPVLAESPAESVASTESKPKPKHTAEKHETKPAVTEHKEKPAETTEPEAPAEGPITPTAAATPRPSPPPIEVATPTRTPKPIVVATPTPTPKPVAVATPKPKPSPASEASPAKGKPLKDVDESLRTLVGPPPALKSVPESSPSGGLSPESGTTTEPLSSPSESPAASEAPSP
jgi:hypothetical protein